MQKWQKWTTAAVLVLAIGAGFAVTGHSSSSAPKKDSVLNYSLDGDVQTLDISRVSTNIQQQSLETPSPISYV